MFIWRISKLYGKKSSDALSINPIKVVEDVYDLSSKFKLILCFYLLDFLCNCISSLRLLVYIN